MINDKKMKIITLNICNVSPGGNMVQGPSLYFFATLLSTLLIIIFAKTIFEIVIYLIIFYYFINVHIAQIINYVIMILYPPFQEQYKKQRILLMIKKLKEHQPDIVCLQEVNITYGHIKYQDYIINEAQKIGFQFYSVSQRYPKFPNFFSVGGMLILSKYKISNSKFHIYKYHPFFEKAIITRGFQHAQIQVKNQIIDVFNIHTSSGNQILAQCLNIKNQEKNIFRKDNQHGMKQFQQIFQILEQRLEQDNNAKFILAGDFNTKADSQDYFMIKQFLESKGIHDKFYQINKTHIPTFGVLENGKPIERLITRKSDQGKQECLDFVFSNLNCLNAQVDHFSEKNQDMPWQQVSDHSSIVVDFIY